MPEPSLPRAAVTVPPTRPGAPPRPPLGGGARDGRGLHTWHVAGERVGLILRRHWLFAVFVALGVVLRVVVLRGYWPALELFTDSNDYLSLAHTLTPGTWHPSGYGLFLAVFSLIGQLAVVTVVQHLMGIAMGFLVYRLVLRLGARRSLAALAALPVLLDGYELSLEQFITAETLTSLLLLGGLTVLFWREKTSARRGAAVALLLTAATLTRTSILPVLIVVGLYLLLRRGHRQALLTYCAVVVAMLGAYGGWYAAAHGSFGFDDWTGIYLYGRVAPFATCDYSLTASEARLCPQQPVSQRTKNGEFYSDDKGSLLWATPGLGSRHQRNLLAERFAITVIEHQPLDYLSVVIADTWHYLTPGRWMTTDRIDMQRWKFPPPHIHPKQDNYHVYFAYLGFNHHRITPSPDPALMGPLRTYQSIVYTPGPAFLACLIAALAVALGLLRRGSRRRHARWACLVLAASAVVLLLSPSLIWGFSYRYELPLLVVCPPAGAVAVDLALDALARRRAGGRALGGAPGRREGTLRRSTTAPTPAPDRTAGTPASATQSE
jgi:Dolichyl-phosphate-mannose-protein mannosyltransferase